MCLLGTGLKLRLATVNDTPAILALERDIPAAAHWSEQQYEEIFGHDKPRRLAVLVDEGEVLGGFLVVRIVSSEWDIENIGVARPLRRRGIGSALLEELLRLAQNAGAGTVFLEVRESNLPARRFYSKMGFLEGSRRKAYYQDPVEDAITYRRQLR